MFEKPGRDKRRKRLANKKRDQWKRMKQMGRKDFGPPKDAMKPADSPARPDDQI